MPSGQKENGEVYGGSWGIRRRGTPPRVECQALTPSRRHGFLSPEFLAPGRDSYTDLSYREQGITCIRRGRNTKHLPP